MGGIFQGIYGNPPCLNLIPTTEASFTSEINKFHEEMTDNPSCQVATDSGWGQTVGPGQCTDGQLPAYQNGLLVEDFRVFNPTCGVRVIGRRGREFKCPVGYTGHALPNGRNVCKRTGPECCDVGRTRNPITFGSGIKMLRETDYQTTDGVRLERHYSSVYFFVPRSAAGDELRDMGMNWRTNYSKRVYPITDSSYVSAAVTFDDGGVQYFDAAGNEVVNYGTAKTRLVTTSGGYELHGRDDSVEYYDSSGKLLSLRSRSGVTQTLMYSDGSDGSQTGLGGYFFQPTGTLTTYVLPAGMLVKVVDSYGRALRFDYDTRNRIARVTLPGGGLIKYSYSNSGSLVRVTQADSTERNYAYNEAGYVSANLPNALTGVLDENGARTISYYYDANGRAYRELSSAVGTNTNRYDLSFNESTLTTTITDPLGAVRTSQFQRNASGILKPVQQSQPAASGTGVVTATTTYDANGNLFSKTDFEGNVTRYTVDPARNLETSRTEAHGTPNARTITTQWHPTLHLPALLAEPGRTTAYTYDSAGNTLQRTITDTTTSQSRTWTYTYNAFGRVLTIDGPRTDVTDLTTFTYYNCSTGNQCGQLATVTDAVGNVTSYLTYNAHGQPLTIEDPNGLVTTLAYDARQRLSSRTVGTEATSFTYHPNNLPNRTTLPDGSYLQYTYDAAHRLTDIRDNEGNKIHYVLNAAGERVQEDVYDPANQLVRTRSRVFDALGRLSAELGAANQTTSYTYDDNGNQTSVMDPLGNVTESTYDGLNRLASVLDAASGLTQYGYDAQDNLASVTDPRQLTTSYQYNGFGDQTRLTSPDTGITQYSRTPTGGVLQSTDARSRVATYTYDAIDRVSTIVYPDQTLQFTYDQGVNGKGRLTQITDNSGSTSWTYDAHGRPLSRQQVVESKSFTTGYGYNASGQLSTITTPSGQVITYGYSNNRVSSINVNATSVLSNVSYAPFGATTGWSWGNGTATVRQYDLDGRLVTISSAGTSNYTLDLDGSIASRVDDFPVVNSIASGLTTLVPATNSNKMMSASGSLTRSYGYDAAGNTLSDGTHTFTYNDAGRLVTANNGTITTTYRHNALGQRVKKSSSAGATHFVYDEAGHLLGEYGANGELIQEVVWFDDIPVATIRTNSGGVAVGVFYVHTDHLNTPSRLTEPTNNAIVWKWDHDPYGNGAANQDPDGNGGMVVFNLRFPGQYYDSETGLHYNYRRDYEPAMGRYVQSDPLGLGGGVNTYGYAAGDPIQHIDPFGLVHWKGMVGMAAAGTSKFGFGPGGVQADFKLISDCVGGLRGIVRVRGAAMGLGWGRSLLGPFSIGVSTVDFEDGLTRVNPEVFNGEFHMLSLGTIAYSWLLEFKLGGAVGTGKGWGLSTDIGALFAGKGLSAVVGKKIECCSQ